MRRPVPTRYRAFPLKVTPLPPTPPQAGRRPKATVALVFAIALLDIMAFGIVIPVLPKLIEEFAGSSADAGVISGAFVALWAAMQFFAAPVIGGLSDRYGRRPIILFSALGLAADYVLMALAPNLWWLALGRVLAGLTSASFNTVSAYMADITPPEGRARAFGIIGAAWSAGFILGPVLGGLLGEISPRAPFWFAGALSGLAFLYGLLVLPESLPRERRAAFAWRRANPFGALRLLAADRELLRLSVVTFLLQGAHQVFASVFVLYAGHRFGWTTAEVGLLLALSGIGIVAVQGFLVGPATARFGERRTLVAGALGGALGVAALGLAPDGRLFTLAILPCALLGFATPTLQALMTRRVSPTEQGRLQGAVGSLSSLAAMLSPLVFGWVYALSVGEAPRLPQGAPFLLAAAILAVAGAIAWRIALRARLST